jgi:hypothetical protein
VIQKAEEGHQNKSNFKKGTLKSGIKPGFKEQARPLTWRDDILYNDNLYNDIQRE